MAKRTHFDNIRPSNLTLPSTRPVASRVAFSHTADQLMPHLFKVVNGHHIKALHVLREELRDGNDILLLHLAEARQGRGARQLIQTCHARESHVPGDVAEFRPDELGDVQQAVVVPTDGNGGWNDHTGSVYGLKDALQVALPCHFFDENGREALRTQLLMHTEVVDFADMNHPRFG